MIEIDEVLEATIASGFRNGRRLEDLALDLLVLRGRLDDDVAIAELVEGAGDRMRSRIALRSASSICPLATWRDSRPLIVASAALRRSSATSLSGRPSRPEPRPRRCRSPSARRR